MGPNLPFGVEANSRVRNVRRRDLRFQVMFGLVIGLSGIAAETVMVIYGDPWESVETGLLTNVETRA